ncbi:MAG: hypothetical protein RIQ33_990, partial [Bacteroidota bacterium]
MKAKWVYCIFLILIHFQSTYAIQKFKSEFANKKLSPVLWIENKGQLKDENGKTANEVLFYISRSNCSVFITKSGFSYVINHHEKNNDTSKINALKIDVKLLGALLERKNCLVNVDANSTSYRFFHNRNSNQPVVLKQIFEVKFLNVYDGINLLFTATDTSIEYQFEVLPFADISKIKLLHQGQDSIKINKNGDVELYNRLMNIVETKPICKQQSEIIYSTQHCNNNGEVTFSISEYDKSKLLVIDPMLKWATPFGAVSSGGQDRKSCITTDKYNNTFIGGTSTNSNFPLVNAGTYFNNSNNSGDVFISKFSDSLQLLWSTFYGSNSSYYSNQPTAIKTDANGNIFVAGLTSSTNFPVWDDGVCYFDSTLNNGVVGTYLTPDAFLLKFDNLGNRIFATLFGGSALDVIVDIDVDANGKIVAVGNTLSTDLPIVSNGAFNDATLNLNQDAFLCRFGNNVQLQWSSYFGGDGNDFATTISCDRSGNFFIGGATDVAINFPIQNNGTYFSNSIQGGKDGFISKFSNSNALVWSTFYGGTGNDIISSSVVNSLNQIVFTGSTQSTHFPVYRSNLNAYIDSTKDTSQYFGGGYIDEDIFYLKFNNNG